MNDNIYSSTEFHISLAETPSELSQTSKMKFFAKLAKDWKQKKAKKPILDFDWVLNSPQEHIFNNKKRILSSSRRLKSQFC